MSDSECKETKAKKVLIVDDDSDFVEAHKMILESGGYEVTVAYSGKECLDKVNKVCPDIILLDMMMESWSEGSNVVEKLRSKRKLKNIPIILISAVNLRSSLTEMSEAVGGMDVDGYLVKPVEPEKLIEQVEMAIKRRQAAG